MMIQTQHVITPATAEDAGDIAKLVNSAYRGDTSRKGWTTEADLLDGTRTDLSAIKELIQKQDVTILKYSADNTIIGCVELHKTGTEMYLGMLTVRPDLQGTGIGKKRSRYLSRFHLPLHRQIIYTSEVFHLSAWERPLTKKLCSFRHRVLLLQSNYFLKFEAHAS